MIILLILAFIYCANQNSIVLGNYSAGNEVKSKSNNKIYLCTDHFYNNVFIGNSVLIKKLLRHKFFETLQLIHDDDSEKNKFIDFSTRSQDCFLKLKNSQNKFKKTFVKYHLMLLNKNFQTELKNFHLIDLAKTIEKAEKVRKSKIKSNSHIFRINLKDNAFRYCPINTLDFIHKIYCCNLKNKEFRFILNEYQFLQSFIDLEDLKLDQTRISFIFILYKICKFSNEFFDFEFDCYPTDIFTKIIFLATILQKYHYYDDESSRFFKSNKNTLNFTNTLKIEYLDFVKILASQYLIATSEFLKQQSIKDDIFTKNKLEIIRCIFDLMNYLMAMLCNIDNIIKSELEFSILYEIDYDLIFKMNIEANDQENMFRTSSNFGLREYKQKDNFWIMKCLIFSIFRMIQLPITFYHTDEEQSDSIVLKERFNEKKIKFEKFIKYVLRKFSRSEEY